MENLENFVLKLENKVKKLKYEQIIMGQEKHPRRINKKIPVPDYAKQFDDTALSVKFAFLVKGKAVINLDKRPYRLKPGDFL